MKLIKSNYEILPQEEGLEGIYKIVEKAGRLCYASDPVEGKAKDFVDKLIKSNHLSVLEHGTVYLHYTDGKEPMKDMKNCPYTIINKVKQLSKFNNSIWEWNYYVTTNLRALCNNAWWDDLQYLCEPTEYHEKRASILFTCDRGISHELVRHRKFSFSQQSQRYCNYSKDKFGKEVSFIRPHWLNIPLGSYIEDDECNVWCEEDNDFNFNNLTTVERVYLASLLDSEADYMVMLHGKAKPEDARGVLPNATATKIIMTGFIEDWKHFLFLRAEDGTGKAHPDMKILTEPIMNDFVRLKII